MRGCGHAHHHDDLYLGSSTGTTAGYANDELLSYWEAKDLVPNHRALLLSLGVEEASLVAIEEEEQAGVDDALRALDAMPWPDTRSRRASQACMMQNRTKRTSHGFQGGDPSRCQSTHRFWSVRAGRTPNTAGGPTHARFNRPWRTLRTVWDNRPFSLARTWKWPVRSD